MSIACTQTCIISNHFIGVNHSIIISTIALLYYSSGSFQIVAGSPIIILFHNWQFDMYPTLEDHEI